MAPLSLDSGKRGTPAPSLPAVQIDPDREYAFVRRDLWRLTIFSVICFALMIGALLWLSA